MDPLNDFERAVLTKLLAGNHAILAALRAQLGAVKVEQREFTGVGFRPGQPVWQVSS